MNDHERQRLLEDAAENLTMLASFAEWWLRDIHHAEGEPAPSEQHQNFGRDPGEELDEGEQPRQREATMSVPDIGDPTGEAATRRDQARDDLRRIDRLLRWSANNAAELIGLVQRHQHARTRAELDSAREAKDAKIDTEDWCRSCLRVQVLSPITVRPDGTPFYRTLCRACGDLLADLRRRWPHKISRETPYPPRELVAHRTYRRLREGDITDLLGPERISA